MGYTPVPLKPYTPKPLKPYLPAPLKPYLPATKRFLPKPDKKLVGYPLVASELEVLKALGRAGGAATVLALARALGKGQKRTSLDCQALAEADYINMFESGFCRIRPLGCQELEKEGELYAGAKYPYSEISYVELQVLKAIAEVGGAISLSSVADRLGMSSQEMFVLCQELGQDNYIDFYRSRLIRLTHRGWQELEKAGLASARHPHPEISLGELQALKAIGEAGGETTAKEIASTQGIARKEAAIFCQALGQRDYIDLFVSGLCRIKPKGWQQLAKVNKG